MTSRPRRRSIPPFENVLEGHFQGCAKPLDDGEPGVVVSLGVRDFLDRVVTEPGHASEISVAQRAVRSSLVVRDALSQTDSQFAFFLTALGYWGYPTGSAVLTGAPCDAGRALRCTSAGRCPPGCHGGQSSGLLSAYTLLFVDSDGGSRDPLDVRHPQVICGGARAYATRFMQRAGSLGTAIISADRSLPAWLPTRARDFPSRWRRWTVGRRDGA